MMHLPFSARRPVRGRRRRLRLRGSDTSHVTGSSSTGDASSGHGGELFPPWSPAAAPVVTRAPARAGRAAPPTATGTPRRACTSWRW